MDVNYHAIGRYVLGRGGRVLTTAHRHAHLAVSAFLLGARSTEQVETALAFEQWIERCGPDDFYTLRRGVARGLAELGLEEVLSLIRLSGFDPRTLRDCLPVLWSHLDGLDAASREELVAAVRGVWERYYPIGEEHDFPFDLGVLLYEAGAHGAALEMFDASLRLHGDDPRTAWNIGLCHLAQGRPEVGAPYFQQAATRHPGFVPTGALQNKLSPRDTVTTGTPPPSPVASRGWKGASR